MQPKPQNGLEEITTIMLSSTRTRFNAAEATEWFRSWKQFFHEEGVLVVSMQPKPQKGLEAGGVDSKNGVSQVSMQPKPQKGLEEL